MRKMNGFIFLLLGLISVVGSIYEGRFGTLIIAIPILLFGVYLLNRKLKFKLRIMARNIGKIIGIAEGKTSNEKVKKVLFLTGFLGADKKRMLQLSLGTEYIQLTQAQTDELIEKIKSTFE